MTTITTSPATNRDSHVDRVVAAVETTMARHHIPGMSLAITPDSRIQQRRRSARLCAGSTSRSTVAEEASYLAFWRFVLGE